MGPRHGTILAWVQYTNLLMTGAQQGLGAAAAWGCWCSAGPVPGRLGMPAPRCVACARSGPSTSRPSAPTARHPPGIAYNITAATSMQAVACPSGGGACPQPYWIFAVAFGGAQLFVSQLPNLDALWQISALGTLMSFGCERAVVDWAGERVARRALGCERALQPAAGGARVGCQPAHGASHAERGVSGSLPGAAAGRSPEPLATPSTARAPLHAPRTPQTRWPPSRCRPTT